MQSKRRAFLKYTVVGAALLGGGLPLGLKAYIPETDKYEQKEEALQGKRWGIVIDTRQLRTEKDFEPLIEACHKTHNVPEKLPDPKEEIKWIWTDEFEHVFPGMENPYLAERLEKEFLLLCNHCDNPPCVRVCPTKATYQRADGVVMMDFHRCIGCRYCMAGCPFGARSFNWRDPAPYVQHKNPDYPARMRGVVEKCTLCYERLQEGKQPACVEASKGAMIFGDLNDPDSEIRKVLREHFTIRRKVQLGTQPSVFYIV